MKHVINFSGGLCSAWAAKRVIEKYGTHDVTLLFADTMIEDPDLYRFNEEWSAHLGVSITRLCVGLTPFELFKKNGLLGNARFKICSIRLKREPLDEWHRINCMEMDTIIYVGMDWNEPHRLKAMREAKPFWKIEAPMMEAPLWDKCRMIEETKKLGIKPPRLYGLGFAHNNCGGGCVASGISQFVRLYQVLPSVFSQWEQWERETLEDFSARGIDASFSILKDRRGGVTKSLLLSELRNRIHRGEKFDRHDWGGCGCGVMYDKTHEEETL